MVGYQTDFFTVQFEMIALIRRILNELPDKSIVLKVHPGENSTIYRKEFETCKNVFVVENQNIIPLIIASEVLIHNSCTTSIEATLLGKPVISFIPFENNKYDSELPNLLGTTAHSINDAITAAKAKINLMISVKQ